MILVTGGAGFIGSNFVLDWLARHDEPVLNLDALTYAASPANLAALQGDARHVFVHGDVRDRPLLDKLLATHRPPPRRSPTRPTAPTAPARPRRTISCAPGTTPTACRY